jgi:[acyl-carrier-protein] S-malonyltransferase
MADPYIILCPGQGAQDVGMGKAWAEASPAARRVFEEADDVLGFKLSGLCFDGPAETLHKTDVAQAAIYVASVACIRALEEKGELNGGLVAGAGLSLGEYTALHLAGAFSFADGLRLVRQRGLFMQEAAEATPSSMVALVGADEAQAREVCDKATAGDAHETSGAERRDGEKIDYGTVALDAEVTGDERANAWNNGGVLVPANFNCPGQVVVSGSKDACTRALQVAADLGLRATELTVAGAFHSPIMQPAAEKMAAALEQAELAAPRVPVLSNVTGQPHADDPEQIKALLVQQITQPVRWTDNVRWLVGNVQGRFIEPAPGRVLSGLMRRIDRRAKVENFAEPG